MEYLKKIQKDHIGDAIIHADLINVLTLTHEQIH